MINDLLEARRRLLDLDRQLQELIRQCRESPVAWIIIANGCYGPTESERIIALFDTKELAEEYEIKSRLSVTDMPKVDGIYRAYRPDSLLWNFNPRRGEYGQEMIVPAEPLRDVCAVDIPRNPSPPTGPDPALRTDGPGVPTGNTGYVKEPMPGSKAVIAG